MNEKHGNLVRGDMTLVKDLMENYILSNIMSNRIKFILLTFSKAYIVKSQSNNFFFFFLQNGYKI